MKAEKMDNAGKLKKDPMMIYSDIPIDQYAWLRKLSDDDLRILYRWILDHEVLVDKYPQLEEVYETKSPDWELLKQAIENEFKRRGISFEL